MRFNVYGCWCSQDHSRIGVGVAVQSAGFNELQFAMLKTINVGYYSLPAELCAIKEAPLFALRLNLRSVAILSDCLEAIQLLKEGVDIKN